MAKAKKVKIKYENKSRKLVRHITTEEKGSLAFVSWEQHNAAINNLCKTRDCKVQVPKKAIVCDDGFYVYIHRSGEE